jgi:glutamate racemase
MIRAPRILVFDSGIGGLSVLRELRAGLPGADFVYVADDDAFPYGDWEEQKLSDHIVALVGRLIAEIGPALVVIACNTASTLVLPPLRARHKVPFVGTVPAIKPAAERTKSGLVSVLATPGTMARDYTRELIRQFASACEVRLVGSSQLAPLAEAFMRGEPPSDAALLAEVAPAFVEKDGRRTDEVVLACTHYPFLLPLLQRLAPWPVEWIDPAPAIARRAASVLGGSEGPEIEGVAWLTSGKPWPQPVAGLLRSMNMRPAG